MNLQSARAISRAVVALYEQKGGANYSGEKVTQLEHASQTAQLAIQDEQTEEVIIAAFLHDIGHLLDDAPEAETMDEFGIKDHEAMGADYLLQHGFSTPLADLVRSHVEAKRYLCAVNKRYYEQLSHASKMTLQHQGGPMNAAEVAAFETKPLKNLIIKMRTWDEEAKHEQIPLIDLTILEEMMTHHLLQNKNSHAV
ncbi:MAG: HDIG domain-containing protein [Bacteroidetes bacterium]|nr:HDIG domain-containing protein [Bacteroidota bacterium]